MLLLNSQKTTPIGLEVFKERPDLTKIIEWARRLSLKEISDLQVIPIDIPYSRLI